MHTSVRTWYDGRTMRLFLVIGLVVAGCGDAGNNNNNDGGGSTDQGGADLAPSCITPGNVTLGPTVVSSGYASELGAQIAATPAGKVVVTFAGNQDVASNQAQGVWRLSEDNGVTFGAQTEF